MGVIDPRARQQEREAAGQSAVPEVGGEGPRHVQRECRVPGAVVGWEHYKSSRKGTPGLMCRFVALDGPDAGAICERTFWLTDAAMGQFADLLICLGHMEPVDPYNDDHLERAFARGAVMMDVKGEPWTDKDGNERTSYRPAWFGAYKGATSSAWNTIMEEAEQGWERYLEWRKRNPRKAPGSGGGGYSQGSSQGGTSASGGDASAYDDIPF